MGGGRLLLDRKLLSQGKSLSDISPLDRLAFVGSSGMGALTYHPKVESSRDIELSLELDEIAKEMNIILEGTDSEMLDELYKMGGSSGGARPKIFIGYNPDNETITYSLTAVPFKENWIIKFPSASDLPDIANIEYAYHQMAIDSGLEMSNCKLFKGKSGKYYFGTKRFDRDGNNRLHLHSACGLMHDNYRLSSMDYGHLMDCAFRLEKHVDAYKKILRLAAFNVFSHNRDDHSKNFSFLMDLTGKWRFAPVYDLTFSYSAYGHHSTMVAGESKSPGKTHLLKLAEHFGVKNANEIIEQVRDVIANWKKYAIEAGVSKASMGKIQIALSAINK
jgi:serine/threonine-protein kinase HipA